MKKYLIAYYMKKTLSVHNVLVVFAKDSAQAKRKAKEMVKPKKYYDVTATQLDNIKHDWQIM